MQIIYSECREKSGILFSKNPPDGELTKKIIAKFPPKASERPVYSFGTVEKEGEIYFYKALQLCAPDSADPGEFFIQAYYYKASDNRLVIDELMSGQFFGINEILELKESGADYGAYCPAEAYHTGVNISNEALRSVIRSIYNDGSICLVVPELISRDISALEAVLSTLLRYIDINTLKKLSVSFNNLSGLDEKPGLALVSEVKRHIPDNHVNCVGQESSDDNSDGELIADLLIPASPSDRAELLGLFDKYVPYCADFLENPAVSVYKGFVEGDVEYLFSIVHSYALDMRGKRRNADIDPGVKDILRRAARDRSIIKLIYDGYTKLKFYDLLLENKGETAFVSSFREVGDLFTSDDAETCSVMLATNLVKDAEGKEKAEILANESKLISELTERAENPFELGMILAYKKVIDGMSGESELLSDIRGRVISSVKELISSCDENTLFSDSTDMKINDICVSEGADRRDYFEDIEMMINERYRTLLAKKVERILDTENKPTSTFDRLDRLALENNNVKSSESAEKQSEAVTDPEIPDGELEQKIALITGMDRENYRAVYYELAGNAAEDQIPELDEPLKGLYEAKLLSLFPGYGDIREEIAKELKTKNSPFISVFAEYRYSDMLCCLLEDCDKSALPGVISRYDPEKTDRRLFLDLLYKKALQIADEEGEDSLESIISSCVNEELRTVLRAADRRSFENLDAMLRLFGIDRAGYTGAGYSGAEAEKIENTPSAERKNDNGIVFSIKKYDHYDYDSEESDESDGMPNYSYIAAKPETASEPEPEPITAKDVIYVEDDKKKKVETAEDTQIDQSGSDSASLDMYRKKKNADKLKAGIALFTVLTVITLIAYLFLK